MSNRLQNTFLRRMIAAFGNEEASCPKHYTVAGQPYRPELLLQPEDIAELACNALLLPRTAEATDLFIRPMHKFSL